MPYPYHVIVEFAQDSFTNVSQETFHKILLEYVSW